MKPSIPTLIATWLVRPVVAKIVSFGVIGLGNTLIDLAIFTVALELMALPLILANVMAWSVAVSCSYFMNTMITFRAESGRVLRPKDYTNFVGSGVLGVFVTTTTLVVLSKIIPVFGAKLISILVSFTINFAMSHFVVFRKKSPVQQNGSIHQ
jgi:putative flippase GtrA